MARDALSFWQHLKDLAHSLLYEKQTTCLLCDAPVTGSQVFCGPCESAYFYPGLRRCGHCGKLIEGNVEECQDCAQGRGPKGLNQVVAWGHYTEAWRELIQDVKFKSQPYLLKRLSQPLAEFAIHHLPPPDVLVPVPMHGERLAERGFNQAAAIASLLHWELKIPIWEGLQRVRATTPQVGLSRQERLHNLEGVFRMTPEQKCIQGARIWLIDDVATTGATLEHCAKELRKNGAEEVYGLVLAAGMEKS
ncbi:putative amidophosphoribosyltransferase [Desulfitobacterium dichloroeliminans LMG P-21439]|uniref:Putative amidophosphoribosyltransferase n=1 Tax=Desulfitobacterium dichloroeliminans (strain LMG P-21439 / DCA1) TaxID=871963 RepID=L0FCW8_DESDL|nr:ComF family protein [Desulfitobacterium dichloroeliminans]AGA70798.1 putative amidophosphoribosyltransferase [Desulfitobacterium dichloroeliminans LMG P-21439]